MAKQAPSIILVDDHIVVRNGLAELINLMGNYEVIAQYGNGQELLHAILSGQNRLPELILMDLTMPVMDGEQTLIKFKEHQIEVPVLILTLNNDDATIIRLYRLGIRGYLSKECNASSLKEAIDSILNKGYYHSDMIYKALMTDEPVLNAAEQRRETILKKLTTRELQFLSLVCDKAEYTYEQIADYMCVSRRTVDGYRESVFEKFGVKSKTGLVLFVIRNNMLDYGI